MWCDNMYSIWNISHYIYGHTSDWLGGYVYIELSHVKLSND